MELGESNLYSVMIVELWKRKREIGKAGENDVQDTSRYEKSEVRLAWLGWDGRVSVVLYTRSGLIPAVSGMVNILAHEIVWSPTFSWWFVPTPHVSLLLILNSTITLEYAVKSLLSISPFRDHQLTPSTVHSEYRVHRVQHILSTTLSQDWLSPNPRQSLLPRHTMLFSVLYIPTITSWPMNTVPGPILLPFWTTAFRLTASKYCSNLARLSPPSACPYLCGPSLKVYIYACTIMATKFASSLPPSACPHLLDHRMQVYIRTGSIPASKWISNLAQSQPPSLSLNSHDYGHKCGSVTPSVYVFNCAWSWYGDTAEIAGKHSIINTPLHLRWHRKWIREKERPSLKSVRWGWEDLKDYPARMYHPNCVDLWTLGRNAWGSTPIVWIHNSSKRVHETKCWEW